jgi:hypothetical protein
MTSIGNSEFPEMTISEAVDVIEGVKREKAQTTTALGKVMGLTNVTTGFFYNKTAALSKFYGLVDRQKADINLTPLAKRVVYATSNSDREAALYEVASRVPLLANLYNALGPEFHELDFSTKLLTITGADREELAAKSPKIEKLYRDAIQYLRPGARTISTAQTGGLTELKPPVGGLEVRGSSEAPWTDRSSAEAIPYIKRPVRNLHSPDGYFIRVRLDVGVIEEAIAVLTALRNREAHLSPGTGSTAEGTPSN